jgi:hypothetical protein
VAEPSVTVLGVSLFPLVERFASQANRRQTWATFHGRSLLQDPQAPRDQAGLLPLVIVSPLQAHQPKEESVRCHLGVGFTGLEERVFGDVRRVVREQSHRRSPINEETGQWRSKRYIRGHRRLSGWPWGDAMPKSVGTARRRQGPLRPTEVLNTVEGQIAEICRDLAEQVKRMRQLHEQADELRVAIREWASPSSREWANRGGRR